MKAEYTPGPYWVRTLTNGDHHVCGRHGATIRRYAPDQVALADADCKRLQKRFKAEQDRIRDAAPELLSALKAMVLNDRHTYRDCHKAALAAIAKATGEA